MLLSSCSTQSHRNRLHKLGIAHGISEWIEDLQNRVSRGKGKIEGFLFSEHWTDESREMIAAVMPVTSNSVVSQQAEVCRATLFYLKYFHKVIKIIAINTFCA